MSNPAWWVFRDGEVHGPFDTETIKSQVCAGFILHDTLISENDAEHFRPAEEFHSKGILTPDLLGDQQEAATSEEEWPVVSANPNKQGVPGKVTQLTKAGRIDSSPSRRYGDKVTVGLLALILEIFGVILCSIALVVCPRGIFYTSREGHALLWGAALFCLTGGFLFGIYGATKKEGRILGIWAILITVAFILLERILRQILESQG